MSDDELPPVRASELDDSCSDKTYISDSEGTYLSDCDVGDPPVLCESDDELPPPSVPIAVPNATGIVTGKFFKRTTAKRLGKEQRVALWAEKIPHAVSNMFAKKCCNTGRLSSQSLKLRSGNETFDVRISLTKTICFGAFYCGNNKPAAK